MKKRHLLLLILLPILLIVGGIVNAAAGPKADENEPFFYTITVTYDGKDQNGKQSSESNIADIKSGIINVKDKLPEGFIFKGFVSNSGPILAKKQDSSESCSGYVIDDVGKTDETYSTESALESVGTKNVCYVYDYKGLHYDENTNVIKFKVNELQAGGKIDIVVAGYTSSIDNESTSEVEKRKDLYNYAEASEGSSIARSNTVHAYMGDNNETLYKVKYTLEGNDIPQGAVLSEEQSYSVGQKIDLAANINAEGYEFSGWSIKSGGVTISNGSFKMPANDVELVGSFTKLPTYKVTYQIEGDGPNNYSAPKEKSYIKGANVVLDSYLKAEDVIGEYKFLGWTIETSGVSLSNGTFEMPDSDVIIKGQWQKINNDSNNNENQDEDKNQNDLESMDDSSISDVDFEEYGEFPQNPKTYDNLYFYVILATFSIAGIYLTKSKIKGKHFAK